MYNGHLVPITCANLLWSLAAVTHTRPHFLPPHNTLLVCPLMYIEIVQHSQAKCDTTMHNDIPVQLLRQWQWWNKENAFLPDGLILHCTVGPEHISHL